MVATAIGGLGLSKKLKIGIPEMQFLTSEETMIILFHQIRSFGGLSMMYHEAVAPVPEHRNLCMTIAVPEPLVPMV